MENNKKAIVLLLVMFVSFWGCASMKGLMPNWNSPGEKNIDPHAKVWEDYNCQYENIPLVKIELSELTPQRIKPEKEMHFKHRLIYGLCAEQDSQEISGRLYTRIRYRDKVIVNDVDDAYVLKPGRWQVDTFIELPRKVEPGVYTLEIEFKNPAAQFRAENIFIVEQGV